jgi:hypothetical protein
MSRNVKAFTAAMALLFVAGPAWAELAARIIKITYQTNTLIPLSADDPTGTSSNTGGYSLDSSAYSGAIVTHVWCELDGGANTVTGGTLKWWKYSNGSWGYASGLDETIPSTGETRWVSKSIKVAGVEGRFYCQPSSVTLSAGTTVTRVYGIRTEK